MLNLRNTLSFILNCLIVLNFAYANAAESSAEEKIGVENPSTKLQVIRNRLHSFSAADAVTLERFDTLTEGWERYHQQTPKFCIATLVKAADLLVAKEMERYQNDGESAFAHVINITSILWEEGKVRSVNVLTSALLDHIEETGVTDEEVLNSFGSRISYTLNDTYPPTHNVEEHRQAHLDTAPIQSIDAQMLELAHRIEGLRRIDIAKRPSEQALTYLNWNLKLLDALHGANEHLEAALQAEITAASLRLGKK